MQNDSCFAGYSAYRYISVYLKMGVFFANTGNDRIKVRMSPYSLWCMRRLFNKIVFVASKYC